MWENGKEYVILFSLTVKKTTEDLTQKLPHSFVRLITCIDVKEMTTIAQIMPAVLVR